MLAPQASLSQQTASSCGEEEHSLWVSPENVLLNEQFPLKHSNAHRHEKRRMKGAGRVRLAAKEARQPPTSGVLHTDVINSNSSVEVQDADRAVEREEQAEGTLVGIADDDPLAVCNGTPTAKTKRSVHFGPTTVIMITPRVATQTMTQMTQSPPDATTAASTVANWVPGSEMRQEEGRTVMCVGWHNNINAFRADAERPIQPQQDVSCTPELQHPTTSVATAGGTHLQMLLDDDGDLVPTPPVKPQEQQESNGMPSKDTAVGSYIPAQAREDVFPLYGGLCSPEEDLASPPPNGRAQQASYGGMLVRNGRGVCSPICTPVIAVPEYAWMKESSSPLVISQSAKDPASVIARDLTSPQLDAPNPSPIDSSIEAQKPLSDGSSLRTTLSSCDHAEDAAARNTSITNNAAAASSGGWTASRMTPPGCHSLLEFLNTSAIAASHEEHANATLDPLACLSTADTPSRGAAAVLPSLTLGSATRQNRQGAANNASSAATLLFTGLDDSAQELQEMVRPHSDASTTPSPKRRRSNFVLAVPDYNVEGDQQDADEKAPKKRKKKDGVTENFAEEMKKEAVQAEAEAAPAPGESKRLLCCDLCGGSDILSDNPIEAHTVTQYPPSSSSAEEEKREGHQHQRQQLRVGPLTSTYHVHLCCAIWSTEVCCDPMTSKLLHIDDAVKRGKQIKCSLCRKSGATLGCKVSSCQRSYHFPCIKEMEARGDGRMLSQSFTIKCPKHSRK